MELDTRFVGLQLSPFRIDVDWRKTTNFAAATGDDNPLFFDDRRPDGPIAPPMLAVALTWPISSNLADYLEVDDFPTEVLMTQIHYSERLDFHRLVRPGDRLTISGRLSGILPHRAGTYSIMRYEAFDAQNRPVFTEHSGVIFRGVKCRGDGMGQNLPEDRQGDWEAGPLWRRKIRIDPMLPYIYDGCSDIVFAIHTSPAFAERLGLPGIILQGTCTLALAARELINREAGGVPQRLKTLSCRFSGMVRPGSTISVDLKSREKENLFFEVTNEDNKKAISRGCASFVA